MDSSSDRNSAQNHGVKLNQRFMWELHYEENVLYVFSKYTYFYKKQNNVTICKVCEEYKHVVGERRFK